MLKSTFGEQCQIRVSSSEAVVAHFHFYYRQKKKSLKETGQYKQWGQLSPPSWLYYCLHWLSQPESLTGNWAEGYWFDVQANCVLELNSSVTWQLCAPVMYKVWMLFSASVRSECKRGCYLISITAQCVKLICAASVSPQRALNHDWYSISNWLAVDHKSCQSDNTACYNVEPFQKRKRLSFRGRLLLFRLNLESFDWSCYWLAEGAPAWFIVNNVKCVFIFLSVPEKIYYECISGLVDALL